MNSELKYLKYLPIFLSNVSGKNMKITFKIGLVVALTLSISACQSTSTQTAISQSKQLPKFVYTPQGQEQFVFAEVPDKLQKYAYTDLCLQLPKKHPSECGLNKLDYNNYVGKKGYYVDTPEKKYRGGYVLREAVLETGEVVYLKSSTKYKHVGKNFISLAEHNKISNFEPEPITKGSVVTITGYSKSSLDRLNVSSQNTHSFTEDEIKAIQRIASKHPKNGARIADLLTTLKVDYDAFEGRTVITHLPFNNKESYLSLKVIVMDNGEFHPWVTSFYTAKDWLFVDSYSVSANGYRWNSGSLDFKRDHTGRIIWEWNNSPLNNEKREMLSKMASSDKSIVRFRGKDYYDDYELTKLQKKELSSLLKVIELMK